MTDLTGVFKDDLSLINFFKLVEDYGICSGLKINHEKSEIMLLTNRAYTLQHDNAVAIQYNTILCLPTLRLGAHGTRSE